MQKITPRSLSRSSWGCDKELLGHGVGLLDIMVEEGEYAAGVTLFRLRRTFHIRSQFCF